MSVLANTFNSWCGGINMGHIGGFSIFNILIIIGIIILIYALVRNIWSQNGKGNSADTDSLQILKNRFAKGEISTEEYNEKKNILKK